MVYFGTNDSNLEGLPGSQFVSLGGYKENLKKIVKHACVTQHQPHVLLVTPGPVNAEQFDDRAKGLRTEENTKKYVEACEEAGAELEGVEVVNLWQAIWSEAKSGHGELKTFFTDGKLSKYSSCASRKLTTVKGFTSMGMDTEYSSRQ